jgi:hypothetical protein
MLWGSSTRRKAARCSDVGPQCDGSCCALQTRGTDMNTRLEVKCVHQFGSKEVQCRVQNRSIKYQGVGLPFQPVLFVLVRDCSIYSKQRLSINQA